MPALNDLERRILDYMVQYLRTNTYQPSVREIGEQFQIKSTKTVSEHLRALADKGYLERDPSRSRGVRILGVDLSPETVSVPCFVALPDERRGFRSDGIEAHYSVDRRMAGAEGCYFVRARGDEFSGAGVERGDFLLVEPASSSDVKDGDLVVVQDARGSELFRYVRGGDGRYLRPARNGGEPVALRSDEEPPVTGRVTGLFRSFDRTAVPISATTH
jgi:repressor LexA